MSCPHALWPSCSPRFRSRPSSAGPAVSPARHEATLVMVERLIDTFTFTAIECGKVPQIASYIADLSTQVNSRAVPRENSACRQAVTRRTAHLPFFDMRTATRKWVCGRLKCIAAFKVIEAPAGDRNGGQSCRPAKNESKAAYAVRAPEATVRLSLQASQNMRSMAAHELTSAYRVATPESRRPAYTNFAARRLTCSGG